MEDNKGTTTDKAIAAKSGYWRVVKVDLEDGTEYKNDKLFRSREEAEESREKCQRKWQQDAWDSREYRTMEYQLRFVTKEEVDEEERQEEEAWQNYLRDTYYAPIVPAKFRECCQNLIADMQQRIEKHSEEDIEKLRHDKKDVYSPWQEYGDGAKLWAYLHLEPQSQKVTYMGMFVKDSLFGSFHITIKEFDSLSDFKSWLADSGQAAAALEERLMDALLCSIGMKQE